MRHAMMPSQANTNVRSLWPGGGAEIPKMKCNPRNIFARNWIMAPLRRCEAKAGAQYDIGPTSFSTSAMSTMTMASHGQPSRKQPSGPLLRHFLQPMQRIGSIWMRPNGGLSSSGTQNMQSSTGQYSTQAGDPAQPVQHSVMTASSLGFFLRAVAIPLERGSCFISSGTIPGAFATCCSVAITKLYLRSQDFVTGVLLRVFQKKTQSSLRSPISAPAFMYASLPLHTVRLFHDPDFRKSTLSRGPSCFERLQPPQNFFAERSHGNASKGCRIGLESPQSPSQ